MTALCKQLNAEGWAVRRLSGHKRICGQSQGHLHGLRFAGRQRYGQIVHGQNIAFAGGARAEHIAPRLHRGERRAEPDGTGRRVGQKHDVAQTGARRQTQIDRAEHARRAGRVKAQADRLLSPRVQRAGERHAQKTVFRILKRAERHVIRQHAAFAAHQFKRQFCVVGAERAEIQFNRQFNRAAYVGGNRGGQGEIGLLHVRRAAAVLVRRAAQQVGKSAQRVCAGQAERGVKQRVLRQSFGQARRADAPMGQRSHSFRRVTASRAIIRPQIVLLSWISPRMTRSNASSSGMRMRPRNSSSSGWVSPWESPCAR